MPEPAGPAIFVTMNKLEQIESAIQQLSRQDMMRLRARFEALDEQRFDEALERDAKARKLDTLAAAARANMEAGRGEEFCGLGQMRHIKDPSFQPLREVLPKQTQALADRNFALLKLNPKHPSQHFKRLKGDNWPVRVGRTYRTLAIDGDGTFQWFWVGTHTEV